MRAAPRPRRRISPRAAVLLSPLFRMSYGRDAYVLRGIGNRWGPVLQVRGPAAAPPAPRGDAGEGSGDREGAGLDHDDQGTRPAA